MQRVACLLSGGLDSALATFILKGQGIPLEAVHFINKLKDSQHQELAQENAEYVCKRLAVPLTVVDLPQSVWDQANEKIEASTHESPNAQKDVVFQKDILFGEMHDRLVNDMGVSLVSTGHWARTVPGSDYEDLTGESGTTAKLLKAIDVREDESHRLSLILQKRLQKTVLPLGEVSRHAMSDVISTSMPRLHEMVERLKYVKKIESRSYDKNSGNCEPGWFMSLETGTHFGRHLGLWNYSIGDSISVKGRKMYIARKNAESGNIDLVEDMDHPIFYCDHILTTLAHWTRYTPYDFFMKHTMKCTYKLNARPVKNCDLIVGMGYEYCGNDHVILSPSSPIWGAEAGGLVALYNDEECIGGARVLRAGPTKYQDRITGQKELPLKNFVDFFQNLRLLKKYQPLK